jgi:hypothetical protein
VILFEKERNFAIFNELEVFGDSQVLIISMIFNIYLRFVHRREML